MCFSYDLSPVQQNETMHNCLETTKLANRICQRSSTAMEAKVKDKEGIKEIRNVSDQLIQIDIRILKSGIQSFIVFDIPQNLTLKVPADRNLIFLLLLLFFKEIYLAFHVNCLLDR